MAERPRATMPPGRAEEFLVGTTEVVLGWIEPDGWPCAGLAAVSETADGQLSVQVADLLGDGSPGPGTRVCAVADEARSYHEIKGVIADGEVLTADGATRRCQIDKVHGFDFALVRSIPESEKTSGKRSNGALESVHSSTGRARPPGG